MIVRMERISLPFPGHLVTAPNTPDRYDDLSVLSTSVFLAPFRIDKDDLSLDSSSLSISKPMGAFLDTQHDKSDTRLLEKWTKLREIKLEVEAKGFIQDDRSVLWH